MSTREVFALLVQQGLSLADVRRLDPWLVKHLYLSGDGTQDRRVRLALQAIGRG